MEVYSVEEVELSDYDIDGIATVFCVHVKINDVGGRAKEIIEAITDKSWIARLDAIEMTSYQARAEQTIEKLVESIFNKVVDTVTEEFGEYLVTESAKDALEVLEHKKLPLAELWKEKITGNPGFDFHTESPTELIIFGEGKYSSTKNTHTIALSQIVEFVEQKKDQMELVDLKNFVTRNAVNNALKNRKGFVAAFSLNGKNYERIFKTAIKSGELSKLATYPELYLIGVEVCP